MTPEKPRGGHNRRTKLLIATLGASLSAGVAAGSGGGIGAPDPPKIRDVTCVERCLDIRKVTETGTIEITGKNLGDVEQVKFPSGRGSVKTEPTSVADGALQARVPKGAESGRPTVVDSYGGSSRSPVAITVRPEGAIDGSGAFKVKRVEATPRKSFFNGKREATVDYLFESQKPAAVRIDVLKRSSDEVVDSIVKKDQEPFANHSASWNGLEGTHKIAPNGDYKFRVQPLSGGVGASDGFSYYDHIFPLRGPHQYGDGLGAGRNHQGQDVFAKCGTRIVAARGGRIQVKAYQSAAGYYVVVDGRKTGKDYVYMHMLRRGRPKLGSRVRTGQLIGYESDTGDASGCHLHFELWSAPGWYEGGHVLNPTRPLKKWDRWS